MSKKPEELTVAELKQLIAQKELDKEVELKQNAHLWRAEVDDYCRRTYEVTLQQIFTASTKPLKTRTYRHPETGEVYTYKGRGQLPKWVKDLEATTVSLIRSVK